MSGAHDSHSSHGDDLPEDIIPENSMQDKILILVSVCCLIGLMAFGVEFARISPSENSAQHESGLK